MKTLSSLNLTFLSLVELSVIEKLTRYFIRRFLANTSSEDLQISFTIISE